MKKTIEMVLATALAASPLFAEAPKFSVAGEVEFEANAQNVSGTWYHDYSSTFNLLFAIQFTDKWSAEAAISASFTQLSLTVRAGTLPTITISSEI